MNQEILKMSKLFKEHNLNLKLKRGLVLLSGGNNKEAGLIHHGWTKYQTPESKRK